MNKEFWKDFYAWLESSSVEELQAVKAKSQVNLENAIDSEVRSSLKRMIRLIEEEVVIRDLDLPRSK